MDILVTGAGGWLGSELTEQLLLSGKRVKAVNFIYTDKLKELKKQYGEKLEVIIGDICDEQLMEKALKGIKKLFHLAAKVHTIPTNEKEKEEFFRVNTKATEKIFEQCMQNKVERVIFFSTVSVYKGMNEKITSTDGIKSPSTIYGKSKLQAEEIANKMWQEKKLPVTIIEPVTVYGQGDVGNFKKLENLIKKGVCIQFGNGNNKKTVVYYKDLIRMAIEISEKSELIGRTLICGTEVISVKDINNTLIEKRNKRTMIIRVPISLAKMISKLCCFSILKKIRRKISALTSNSEFITDYELENYTSFHDYYIEKKTKGNILMITSEYPDVKRSSNIYTDLAEALMIEGYNVKVVITEESKNISYTNVFQENNISVLRVRVGNIYNVGLIEKGITFFKSGFLVKRAISKFWRNEEFDLILFMSQPVTLAKTVGWAMKKFSCPSYLMMKDIFPQNGVDIGIITKKNPAYWYFKWQEKKLYNTATTIGCMSEENKIYLLKHNTYLKEEKMEIFPNTQKLEELKEKTKEYPLRNKYGIPKNSVLAVYGGNLGKPQGVDFFKEVLNKYKERNDINFLIIARGTEKENLFAYIDNNKISNVYKFDLMPREDYQNIVNECDIGLIFLDRRFTIPNYPSKVLSYFNIGIPVMAAVDLNNDFKDMLEKSNSGFWTEAGDLNDYVTKLDRLIQDEELRNKMGKQGREYLENNFSLEVSVNIINDYIERQRKSH